MVTIVVFFLLFACLHFVIHHPTICVMFVNLPDITLVFSLVLHVLYSMVMKVHSLLLQ
jgi:hypothetical protein